MDPVASRLEYPFRYGQQDIRIGCPLSSDTLRTLPLAERSLVVVNAINVLAPENELPLPRHPGWPCSEPNILVESLRYTRWLCEESRMVLAEADGDPKAVRTTHPAPKLWIDEFAAFLRNVVI